MGIADGVRVLKLYCGCDSIDVVKSLPQRPHDSSSLLARCCGYEKRGSCGITRSGLLHNPFRLDAAFGGSKTLSSRLWKKSLALGYIADIVTMAHNFVTDLLRVVCPLERVQLGVLSLFSDHQPTHFRHRIRRRCHWSL